MYRTFNCGVGMIVALPVEQVEEAIALLNANGEKAWKIGNINRTDTGETVVINA